MFKSSLLIPEYQNLLGWEQHYDETDISIPLALTVSETGEFYQQKHPALDLAIIRALIPSGRNLDEYLQKIVSESTNEMFNDVLQYRQISHYGKTLLQTATLLNKIGWRDDGIVNRSRFVGFRIRLNASTGLEMAINEIGLQFQQSENFNLYLFHDSKEDAIKTIPVTTNGNSAWKWELASCILAAFKQEEYYGGAFVLGYYQDDLEGMAINYSNFNWNRGECGTCNKARFNNWENIQEYYDIFPIYVPEGKYVVGKMFDLDDAFYVEDQSFGLNLRLTVKCDLTQFFIDNKINFKNLLSLKVTHKILYMMKFSQQISFVEENIKMMIIRDLEGDKETNYLNTTQQYNREMKAVQFNIDGISAACLPSYERATLPTVSSV